MEEQDEENDIAFVMMVIELAYNSFKLLKRRRWWVRPLYQERSSLGFFEKTFKFIKAYDEELFFKSTRMSKMQYELLLNLVKNDLTKTSIRKPIGPECRMVVTLMYLSQGVSPNFLAWSFRMGVSTVREIILEVCDVFWKLLSPVYMPELNTADWKSISQAYQSRWNMPHCVGSIDGKHIQIKCPPHSGSKYINYKGFFSIVLMAICDSNYTFTAVDVGAYGTQSDGGIFRNCSIGKAIIDGVINLPSPKKLPSSDSVMPFYFVGDSAFPLRSNLMRPFPGILLDKPEEVFNYRLSRARLVIENTFGILTARWRILGKFIEFYPKNADKIVLACTILHNFIKITDTLYNTNLYCPENFCDSFDESGEQINGMWRDEITSLLSIRRCGSNNRSSQVFEIRNTLKNYFLNEGKVPFQPH